MKKILLSVCCVLCSVLPMSAQEEPGTLNDKERVALTPIVLDDAIPEGARKQLENKMTQLAAKSGCAAMSNSRFIITCSADVLTQDVTPTAPPMHAYTLALHFYVGDGVEGRLFSSYTVETKGVGKTPDKAYINALKNVKINDPGLKAMVENGKKEIIAYYNTNCNLVIAEAKSKANRQEFSAAIDQLTAVPPVCEECYLKALAESEAVYQAWRDQVCNMALSKAKSEWAKRDVEATADALALVPIDGACYEEACELRKTIGAKLDAKEREEWEFKMQQYEDRMAAQEAAATNHTAQAVGTTSVPAAQPKVSAVREAAQAVLPDPAPTKPVYQVKGKWFK